MKLDEIGMEGLSIFLVFQDPKDTGPRIIFIPPWVSILLIAICLAFGIALFYIVFVTAEEKVTDGIKEIQTDGQEKH